MRTIYYASNSQYNLFPNNSRSKFECYIRPGDLDYIPFEGIEVAIKSISFDYDLENESPQVLALKTNLSYDTISSYGWNNIVAVFTVAPKTRGLIHFEFTNPSFYRTNREKLSKSEFSIIDLKTGDRPNFSFGRPTFIQAVVRSELKRMKTPINMLLDSACMESFKKFPNNTNTDFTIQLPKRFEFQKDWSVCLKSIHFANNNLDTGDFFFTLNDGRSREQSFTFQSLSMKNISEIMDLLNAVSKEWISFNYNKGSEKVLITAVGDLHESITINFSRDFVKLLGLEDARITFSTSHRVVVGKYNVNMHAVQPLHYLVCCDIVEDSILGGQHVQVLKYFSNDYSSSPAVDKHFSNNDFVTMTFKNFDRIRIRISDLSGETIRSVPDIPTRLQLLFLNTNSV